MLITPILKSGLQPFNATLDYDFIFYVDVASDQVVRNNLVIEKVSDNTVVYNQTQESFSFKHKILANTLQNGVNYKAKIRTGNINNEWSQFSEYEIFWCFSPPTVNIVNIDYDNQHRVYNQTVEFRATYTQSELEELKSYRFLLYDSNKNLKQSFPEKFYNNEEYLTQEVAGLENGELYYIEVKTLSVNDNEGKSLLEWFRPFYITPRLFSVLTLENLSEQGAIKVSANILQILGKLYDNEGNEINPLNVEYIDDEWLDLTRIDYDRLVYDESFNILQSDFILKLWCKNFPDDLVFLILYSSYGKIELMKYNNRIHAFKSSKYHKLKSHFVSDEFDFTSNLQYMIYLKQENNLIDIKIQPY